MCHDARKPVFGGLLLRDTISAFIFRLLESIMTKLATGKISILLVDTVAELTCLSMTWSETLKTGFLASRPV